MYQTLKKQGGSYQIKKEKLRRIDDIKGNIEFIDRTKININKIIKIEADSFQKSHIFVLFFYYVLKSDKKVIK